MATTIKPTSEAHTKKRCCCCNCQAPYPFCLFRCCMCSSNDGEGVDLQEVITVDGEGIDLQYDITVNGEGDELQEDNSVNVNKEELLKRLVALYDYQATDRGAISMTKGDILYLISDEDPDWWKATNAVTQRTGYIPRSYVAEETAIDSEEWFFGDVSFKEAQELLKQSGVSLGAFIVRQSATKGMYALSVRVKDPQFAVVVKHFKIKPFDNGGCFISPTCTFPSLRELVAFYSEDPGLGQRLGIPCPKPKPHMWDLSQQTKDHWEVDRKHIKFLKRLGSGNFGEVWQGLWNEKDHIAVKMMKSGSMTTEQFLEEANIMKQIRHEKLVSLYAVCSDKEPLYIITEYMPLGSLQDYLRSDEGKQLEFPTLIYMAVQIANGMMYLEERQLVHRDLAARNVLVGYNDIVKIGDFGLARLLHDETYMSENSKAPTKWTAPEALSEHKFTIKSDVWSFGILLMEIVTHGEKPYPAMNNQETYEFVDSGLRMSKPRHHFCNDLLYNMMLQCWDKDPQKRPTFESLHHSLDDYLITADKSYVPKDEVQFAEE